MMSQRKLVTTMLLVMVSFVAVRQNCSAILDLVSDTSSDGKQLFNVLLYYCISKCGVTICCCCVHNNSVVSCTYLCMLCYILNLIFQVYCCCLLTDRKLGSQLVLVVIQTNTKVLLVIRTRVSEGEGRRGGGLEKFAFDHNNQH
jgi:hypothetical protein